MFLGLTFETWAGILSVGIPLLAHIFGKVNIPMLPPAITPAPVVPAPLSNHPELDKLLKTLLNNALNSAAANPSGNPPVGKV